MSQVSDCIKPFPVPKETKEAKPRTVRLEDASKVIYPENKDGERICVRICKRKVISSCGAEATICRMGKKRESFKIKPFLGKERTATRKDAIEFIRRIGGQSLIPEFLEA